jgi:prepilin-type N-terminal cleavage/methylation domain-containing protein
MSDTQRKARDRGMTLPEVLISISITGIIMATLSFTATVILRQMDNTEGRTNNARSEQNVGFYMPTDLSSAERVELQARALPCGPAMPAVDPGPPPLAALPALPACPPGFVFEGSNSLMVSWTGSTIVNGAAVPTLTVVSYRVVETASGEFQLHRVECYSVNGGQATCSMRVVLRDLEPPPPGFAWVSGVSSPTWIMTVSQAFAANCADEALCTVDPGLKNKNAQRVVVTINGGGDAAGAGGGQNQISLSAGGTNRENELTIDDLQGAPSFTAARSRCGGNFGMVVDTSGSIGDTNMATVRTGIQSFIDTFAGTPVKLQIVRFSETATTLGSGAAWTKYFDMLIEADVAALKAEVGLLVSDGSTNWEDGLFRMIRNSDGTIQAALPKTIIFFTDGVPNRSRVNATTGTAPAVPDPLDAGLSTTVGSGFHQISWNRAERMVRDRGSIDLVGVYVNTSLTADSDWTVPGAGYHKIYEVGDTVVYQQGTTSTTYEVGNTVVYQQEVPSTIYERRSSFTYQVSGNNMSYYRFSGGNWVDAGSGGPSSSNSRSAYLTNNTSPGDGDGWRATRTGNTGSWQNITAAQYWASNAIPDPTSSSGDGFRTSGPGGSWVAATQAEYDSSNTTSDTSDGWRTSSSTSWVNVTAAAYEAGNVDSSTGDGYRTQVPTTPTSWSTVTQSLYNESNIGSDSSDGWRSTTTTNWANVDIAVYNAGNVNNGTGDGFRTQVPSTPSAWSSITKVLYDKSNSTSNSSDGFRETRVYAVPYDFYEASSSFPILNYSTIGNLVVSNLSGVDGGYVEALPRGGPYPNAAAADLFIMPNYSNFNNALSTIALGQCGGTVTFQTRIGANAAQDPFTYVNETTNETVQTSALYRSGTFDVALPGGAPQEVVFSPQDFTTLEANYTPTGWTCKSAGAAYPFVTIPIPDHDPWTSIRLTVNPNQAVSCILQVTYTP